DAWEIFRVIPAAAMTGEAAGTAAAIASELKIDPCEVNIELLQHELKKQGGIIHIADGYPFNEKRKTMNGFQHLNKQ
ncbi:MAG: FAD-dependent oxidoreductase, partial [Lentisphaeria bacterium]|nr:FAD-dependent oxidoreductase [Lentisphaeria bacterium]